MAIRDVDEAIKHDLDQDAAPAASGLIDALEQAYAHISKHGATGSPRYAHEWNLPGLRFWPMTRYPYLIFHIEQDDHIDVCRMLHGPMSVVCCTISAIFRRGCVSLTSPEGLVQGNTGWRVAPISTGLQWALLIGQWIPVMPR